MERHQLVLRLVGLTVSTSAWCGVVTELRRSCHARAAVGDVLDVRGAVGVLRGASPVVWLHHADAVDVVAEALVDAPAVTELYAGSEVPVATLEGRGWRHERLLRQMVQPLPRTVEPLGHPVEELDAADVPAFVAGLQRAHRLTDEVVAACYPSDFLERAQPVRLWGVRQQGQLLGAVATRRPFEGALLFALWVAPAERHRGIARSLVAAASQAEQQAGATFLHAQVSAASLPLMLSLGWEDCGGWQHLVRAVRPIG